METNPILIQNIKDVCVDLDEVSGAVLQYGGCVGEIIRIGRIGNG